MFKKTALAEVVTIDIEPHEVPNTEIYAAVRAGAFVTLRDPVNDVVLVSIPENRPGVALTVQITHRFEDQGSAS